MSLKIDIGGSSWIGDRDNQEDCYMAYNMKEERPKRATRFNVDYTRLVSMGVLCDGMGGEGKGDQCACLAVQKFAEAFAETGSFKTDWVRRMEMALYAANAAITDYKQATGDYDQATGKVSSRSGCVMVATVICDEHLYYISVGDACIWLFRRTETPNGTRYQQYRINRPHSVYTKFTVESGIRKKEVITPEEAEELSRNYLPGVTVKTNPCSALIGDDINFIDNSIHSPLRDGNKGGIRLKPGDIIILASDGVEKGLGPISFESVMRDFGDEDYSAAQTAAELIKKVEEQSTGKSDNSSCVVFKVSAK